MYLISQIIQKTGIYEVFSGTTDFELGLQPNPIDNTLVYVMPSSSARCSNLPRATDKLPFYKGNYQALFLSYVDFIFVKKFLVLLLTLKLINVLLKV